MSADVCEGLDAVPGQAGQQMRSGIIAPTVPASRVHTICRCNSLAQGSGPDKVEAALQPFPGIGLNLRRRSAPSREHSLRMRRARGAPLDRPRRDR